MTAVGITASMRAEPLVSVGVPVFNGERYLREAIRSILDQTYRNLELIISDNASTDGTRSICEEEAANDSRVRYCRSDTNRGLAWNFNNLVDLARGPYFKWMSCDDTMEETFIRCAVDALESHPDAVLSHSDTRVIGTDGEFLRDDWTKITVADDDPVRRFRELMIEPHTCMWQFGLIRLDALRGLPWRPMGGYSHADGILLARLALIGWFHRTPEPLFSYRRHPEQSMAVYAAAAGRLDRHALAAFVNPAMEGRLVFPNWRLLRENAATAASGLVPLRRRPLALLWVVRWALRKRALLLSELAVGVRTCVDCARGRLPSRR